LKTLYSVLGISADADATQIENAYQKFLSMLNGDYHGLTAEEINIQTIAVKEAYRTLSNPILRQRYNQKIEDANATRIYESTTSDSGGGFFNLKAIALIGLIGLTGLYFYNQNVKDREKLRIQHEHEVQMKAVQIIEDQQRQVAKTQDAIVQRSSAYSDGQQLRQQQQQFERESIQAQQLDNQRRQLEFQQQQQKKRDDENRLRQEQMRYQQQLQNDKRQLQQMEINRYGRVITP